MHRSGPYFPHPLYDLMLLSLSIVYHNYLRLWNGWHFRN
jgi:hypothetical protein